MDSFQRRKTSHTTHTFDKETETKTIKTQQKPREETTQTDTDWCPSCFRTLPTFCQHLRNLSFVLGGPIGQSLYCISFSWLGMDMFLLICSFSRTIMCPRLIRNM